MDMITFDSSRPVLGSHYSLRVSVFCGYLVYYNSLWDIFVNFMVYWTPAFAMLGKYILNPYICKLWEMGCNHAHHDKQQPVWKRFNFECVFLCILLKWVVIFLDKKVCKYTYHHFGSMFFCVSCRNWLWSQTNGFSAAWFWSFELSLGLTAVNQYVLYLLHTLGCKWWLEDIMFVKPKPS